MDCAPRPPRTQRPLRRLTVQRPDRWQARPGSSSGACGALQKPPPCAEVESQFPPPLPPSCSQPPRTEHAQVDPSCSVTPFVTPSVVISLVVYSDYRAPLTRVLPRRRPSPSSSPLRFLPPGQICRPAHPSSEVCAPPPSVRFPPPPAPRPHPRPPRRRRASTTADKNGYAIIRQPWRLRLHQARHSHGRRAHRTAQPRATPRRRRPERRVYQGQGNPLWRPRRLGAWGTA